MFELFRNSSSFHIIFEFSKYLTLLGKPVRIAVAGKVSFEVLPDKSFFWAILLPFLGERAGIGFAGAGTVFFCGGTLLSDEPEFAGAFVSVVSDCCDDSMPVLLDVFSARFSALGFRFLGEPAGIGFAGGAFFMAPLAGAFFWHFLGAIAIVPSH